MDGDATELPRSADGLTISRGFPAELDVPSRGGDRGEDDTSDDIAAEPAAESPDSSADATCDKAPPHFLVPASHWPNDPCDEHGGKGWEVSVVEKKGAWWKVRYVKARPDDPSQKWEDNWRRWQSLIPLSPSAIRHTISGEAPTAPMPNRHTAPAEDGADPLVDDGRPKRDIRPVERLTAEQMGKLSGYTFSHQEDASSRIGLVAWHAAPRRR